MTVSRDFASIPGFYALCVIGGCALAGCSKASRRRRRRRAAPRASCASAGGRIVGTAPRAASGATVVTVLDSKPAGEYPPQTGKPAMDQISATFTPAMLYVRTNQPDRAFSRTTTARCHNVHVTHVETREGQFNVAIPTGEVYDYTFKREGSTTSAATFIRRCRRRSSRRRARYLTAADGEGGFAFEDVPPGAYAVTVYAGAQRLAEDVDVKVGTTTISVE